MINTEALNRVGITHQHHRCIGIITTKHAHILEHITHTHIEFERSLIGPLYHRTFGHRIREWHTKLEDINATIDHRMHQRHCELGCRITCCDEGNQCLFLFRLQGVEGLLDSGHINSN